MKIRTRVAVCLSALLFLAGAAVMSARAADDPAIGTWKLNEAKSKIGKGMPKNDTVVYSAAGDSINVTVDGVGSDGKPSHNEWTGKFDGKDYPVTGDSTADTRCYTRVDSHTLKLVNKKGGKATTSGTLKVSADGKTRTVTTTTTDAAGKKSTTTAVYDKQ
jgi:hypothetical protein